MRDGHGLIGTPLVDYLISAGGRDYDVGIVVMRLLMEMKNGGRD